MHTLLECHIKGVAVVPFYAANMGGPKLNFLVSELCPNFAKQFFEKAIGARNLRFLQTSCLVSSYTWWGGEGCSPMGSLKTWGSFFDLPK